MPEIMKNARRDFVAQVGTSPVRPKLKVLQSSTELESQTPSRPAPETPAVVPPPVVGNGGARQASVTSVADATYTRPAVARATVGRPVSEPMDQRIERFMRKMRYVFGAKPAAEVEHRRCYSCGETMRSNRYRRSLLRFVRIYRCTHCRRVMEQESRGYQGFYVGTFLTLMTPFFTSSITAASVSVPEVAMLSLVTLLGLWPAMANIGRYMKAPVLARMAGQALLPRSSGRTLLGRVLGGESRFYGLLAGIAFGLILYTTMALLGLIMARV